MVNTGRIEEVWKRYDEIWARWILSRASGSSIASIHAWACTVPLAEPLSFGDFVVTERKYVAVRVVTADGLVADSLGLSRGSPIDVAITEVVAPLLVGRDAMDVPARTEDVRRGTRALDADGVIGRAWSMVEVCLWDLKAQQAGLPLWQFLGGAARRVPVLLVEGYPVPGETDQAFAERLAGRVSEGYRMIKIEAASYPDARQVTARLAALRDLVGNTVDVVVDMAWSWPDPQTGWVAARDWEQFDLAWIEDPIARDRPNEIATLRSRLNTPIAGGDEATRPGELIDLLNADAIDILRLDATAIGGLSMVSDLVARATAAGKRLSTHVHPETHQHCAFAWPQLDHIEAFPSDRPFDHSARLLTRPFIADVVAGEALPPSGPGSSLQLDLGEVRRTMYRESQVRS